MRAGGAASWLRVVFAWNVPLPATCILSILSRCRPSSWLDRPRLLWRRWLLTVASDSQCPTLRHAQRRPRGLTRSLRFPVQFLSAPNHLWSLPARLSVSFRALISLGFREPGLQSLANPHPTTTPPRPNPLPAVASAEENGSEPRPQALLPPALRRSESLTSGNPVRWERRGGFTRSDNPDVGLLCFSRLHRDGLSPSL